jgi:hypothetical protein
MANQDEIPQARCAVRAASDAHERQALAACAARVGHSAATEFAPRDDEELDEALCAGRFRQVIFADLDALLTMVWKSQARVERWIDAGVRIELAQPPDAAAEGAWLPVVLATCQSLGRWRRAQRLRKLVAAVVLSVLALAAAAVLLLLIPPAR